ncbi:MAG TPA: sigma-70 family RNA polymerase sigma factor [Pyrinomonadaceae bacterium]|nr:sigma-70 family RNA polymerase sigma factor [Pyrinomonadaceae bacterium]
MAGSQQQTDAELLGRMLVGDEDAFTALYRRRQPSVYRFALQMSGSEAVAEDVVQETFMVLMRDASNFDPARGSLAAYLYGIARNHVLRAFDRERALVRFDDETEEGRDAPHENLITRPDPLGDMTRAETVEQLRQAVLALPTHYREVVVLCELHEMSYVEAAEALDCAVGTVRSRLHRARAMLAEKMRGRRVRESAREGGAAGEGGEGRGVPAQGLKTARCFA